jgi:alanyl-tRNA synthetase
MSRTAYKDFAAKHPSKFVGYADAKTDASITGILVGGKFVPSLNEGEEGFILLNQTPFYAEKGGQIGDTGILSLNKATFKVTDCQAPFSGVITHIGSCISGTLNVGDKVKATVDHDRRLKIQNNHTATHLLHWALVQVLGQHIRQAGSLVETNRFRFDFNHHKALSPEEIQRAEDLVNEKIRENKPVKSYELPYEDVQKMPEIKQFFGDKYGAKVRVIDIEESKELCGGTHTSQTGNIGYFRIIKEGSIAAGVRRMEATSGKDAEAFAREQIHDLEHKIDAQMSEHKKLEHELKALRTVILRSKAQELAHKIKHIGSIPLIAEMVDSPDLGILAEEIAQRLHSGVILLAFIFKDEGRCIILLRITPDFVKKGLNASEILKKVAHIVGGSGGGRPELAQAGGKSPEHLDKLFEQVREIL